MEEENWKTLGKIATAQSENKRNVKNLRFSVNPVTQYTKVKKREEIQNCINSLFDV